MATIQRTLIALASIATIAATGCGSPTDPGSIGRTTATAPAAAGATASVTQSKGSFPPFPTPPKIWTLTGTVIEESPTGPRPVVNAAVSVFMWVSTGNGGQGGYAAGSVTSDAAGHFSIASLPVGTALLLATAGGYRQPCAVSFDLTGNMSHDIDVVFDPSLVGTALPADMAAPPLLTGVVYETTPDGRLPVAGANVTSGDAMGIVTATTMTDASGRYQFCGLPWNRDVWASKDGYGVVDSSAPLTGAITSVDIEIRRTR